jgi:hypothetical protein
MLPALPGMSLVSFVRHSGFLCRFRRAAQLSGMETFDTSNGEGKLSYSQAAVVMSFVRYSSTFGGIISAPTDLADFWIPFLPVLIGFNYSAHVSLARLVVPPLSLALSAPHSGNITRSSSQLLPLSGSPTFSALSIVRPFLRSTST